MQSSSDPKPGRPAPGGALIEPPALAAWLPWLQLGLSSMLLVLFLVMLARTRELSRSQQLLEQRLAGLENSRRLDRTTALEQQIQAMLQRLQSLESVGSRLDRLNAQQEQLQQQLLLQRGRPLAPEGLEPDLPPSGSVPRQLSPRPLPGRSSTGSPGTPGSATLRGTPPVLRPPAMESF